MFTTKQKKKFNIVISWKYNFVNTVVKISLDTKCSNFLMNVLLSITKLFLLERTME